MFSDYYFLEPLYTAFISLIHTFIDIYTIYVKYNMLSSRFCECLVCKDGRYKQFNEPFILPSVHSCTCSVYLPGVLGTRSGLSGEGPPSVLCSDWALLCMSVFLSVSLSCPVLSSRRSRSFPSVFSRVCVAWVRSNSPLRPSFSNSCWAWEIKHNRIYSLPSLLADFYMSRL